MRCIGVHTHLRLIFFGPMLVPTDYIVQEMAADAKRLLIESPLNKIRSGLLLACCTRFATLAAITWLHRVNSDKVKHGMSELAPTVHNCIR